MHFALPTAGLDLPCAVPNFTNTRRDGQPAYPVYKRLPAVTHRLADINIVVISHQEIFNVSDAVPMTGYVSPIFSANSNTNMKYEWFQY